MTKRKKIPATLRHAILKRDGFRCCHCGRTAKDGAKLHIDHIKPVALGGTNDPSNLQTLCRDCNLGKSDIPQDDHSYLETGKRRRRQRKQKEEQRQQKEREQQDQKRREEEKRKQEAERERQQQETERKREKQKAEEREALHTKKDDRKQLEVLLQKIEYFHARATTPGERIATGAAIERIKQKLYSFSETKPSVEAREQQKTERNSSQAEVNLREAERQWRQAEEARLEREKQERAERRKEQWQKWRQWQQEFENKYENYLVVATVGLVTLLLVIGMVGLRVVTETSKAKKELAIATELWRESEDMLAAKKKELEEQKRREEEEKQRLLAEQRQREEEERKEQERQWLAEERERQEREAVGCGCCSGGVVTMVAVMAYPCYCTVWWLAALMF